MSIYTTESLSFFDDRPSRAGAIIPLQTDPTMPSTEKLDSATGGIVPDLRNNDRLRNFPEDYDLGETSHLLRFMHAMLGDAGAGQLRKRLTVARFQSALTSTHFFDLDGFYGALFGVQRRPDEQLPIDPMVDLATPDEWDDIYAADSKYRERIFALAKSLPMGATVPGIQTAAEALTGVPCDVYEVWALVDDQIAAGGTGSNPTALSWDTTQAAYVTWDAIEGANWDVLSGGVQIGDSATINRSQFIVRPKKTYPDDDGGAERAVEEWDLLRVLSVLKPAGTLLTVDSDGVAMHVATPITNCSADSNYWEVTVTVVPKPAAVKGTPAGTLYPLSKKQVAAGMDPSDPHVKPAPAFVRYSGESVSYASQVVSVRAYAHVADTLFSATDYEVLSYRDGHRVSYVPSHGTMDPRMELAGRYAADGQTVAAPYSAPRLPVISHG